MPSIPRFETKKMLRFTVLAAIITAIWICALFLADYVANDAMAQNLVGQFGYIGTLVIAIIAGLNVLVPVPAAAFVPIFVAAGLYLPIIILMLVVGTTIADAIGYFIGHWSREFVERHYPRSFSSLQHLNENHHRWVLPAVFLYAAVMPFPNEAIVIPLALIGFRFQTFLLPLILGNIVNQTALAYGMSNIFTLLFNF